MPTKIAASATARSSSAAPAGNDRDGDREEQNRDDPEPEPDRVQDVRDVLGEREVVGVHDLDETGVRRQRAARVGP